MKKLGLIVVALALLVAGGLFWLRGNLDGLVKDAIATQGSAMTQARVSVGAVEIRSSDGVGIIRDLSIGNPAGFKTPHALKVSEIEVGIDIGSLAREVIVIRKIAIKAPDVIYEKGDSMTNFEALQKNIATYLGPTDKRSEGVGKKLIVEELTVRDAKAQASAAFMQGKTVSVPLPDIALRNVGKAKGGIPPGELGQEIAQALKQKLSSAVSFDALAKSAGQALDKAGSAIKGLFGK
jgi:uncharacterized protein involved in outer membrane biogenesis